MGGVVLPGEAWSGGHPGGYDGDGAPGKGISVPPLRLVGGGPRVRARPGPEAKRFGRAEWDVRGIFLAGDFGKNFVHNAGEIFGSVSILL